MKAHLFNGSIMFIYILYLAIFFGILSINKDYIRNFSTLIQLGVCLFLIYRFSPFLHTNTITKLDKSIIFYCASFLLMNVVATEVYIAFLQGTTIGNYITSINTYLVKHI